MRPIRRSDSAPHTGLRIGNLKARGWSEVDLTQRTLTVAKTKNGQPQVSPLSDRAVAELAKLPGKDPAALVFAGRGDRPFNFSRFG